MGHAFNTRTQETAAGRSLWVQEQPGLQIKFHASQGYVETVSGTHASQGYVETVSGSEVEEKEKK